jgi:hypothetical protein
VVYLKPENEFTYHDNDTPEEHEKELNKEYWFALAPFVLLIFLALFAILLLLK